jgi:hypothetical protein
VLQQRPAYFSGTWGLAHSRNVGSVALWFAAVGWLASLPIFFLVRVASDEEVRHTSCVTTVELDS